MRTIAKSAAVAVLTVLLVAGCNDGAKKPDHNLNVKHPSGSRSPVNKTN